LFSGLGKLVGKIASTTPIGGTIKTAINIGAGALRKIGRRNLKKVVAAGGAAAVAGGAAAVKIARSRGGQVVMAGAGGTALGAMMAGGGGGGFRRRRINPGNTKAMRRAIRRIEGGARLYSKFFRMKTGSIRGAPGVRVKKLSIRRAA
jgi:hypothetical protein